MKPNNTIYLFSLITGLITSQVHAAITFNFTYEDQDTSSGLGFDDTTEGIARRNTVAAVGDYLNTVLDENGSVDIHWNTSINDAGSSTLGSMGSFYFINQGVDDGLVFKHITTGVDPTSSALDGSGQINFGRTWNSDYTTTTASGEFDLFTVVLHEITHALGVNSLIDSTDGSAAITGTYSTYDTFLSGPNGDFLTGSTFTGNVVDFTSDQVKFASSTMGALDIYSPNPYESGSSISHLAFTHSAVMNPSISSGVEKRTYSAEDLALLGTIGYSLIPEPSGVTLLLFSSLGLVFVRKRPSF